MSADAASHHKKVDESEPYHHHVPRVSLLTPFYSGIYMESEENAVVIPVVAAPAPAKEVNSLNVNYRGLLNLCLIVLTLSNVRLMVENIRKYGILLDFSVSTEGFDLQSWPSVSTVASFSLYILAFWLMELRANAEARALIANRKASTPLLRVIVPLHVILLIAVVLQPPVVIWFMQPPPLANLLVMMISTVLFTKLWSYAAVNRKLRRTWMTAATAKKTDDGDTTAPKASEPVITLGGLAYFMALPTLCYQPVFPRTPAIRWAFVLRLVVELSFICFVEYFIAMQYMLPLLNNTLGPVARLDVVQIVERVLKIAVPNLIIWLLGFYAFFHLYLNLIAELLRFADREFYRDWWNCTTVGYFWRTWNMPVHNFFVQHVFKPLVTERHWSPKWTGIFVFFVSAVFHELIVSASFSTVSLAAFGGMILQVVAVKASAPLRGRQLGNVFFWLTIMVGQPLIVLYYFIDYANRNSSVSIL